MEASPWSYSHPITRLGLRLDTGFYVIESVAIPVLGFFVGSLPTAYLAGRLTAGRDIRTMGSGNPGALNAYRQLGGRVGAAVMVVDTGKGALVVFLGMLVGASDLVVYLSAVFAALGHNFSPFTGLRGGKGGATVLGISLLMVWDLTLASIAIGAVTYVVTRHSISALTAIFVALNVLTIATGQPVGLVVTCLALSTLVVVTHLVRSYPDIARSLRRGDWRGALDQE